MAKLDVIAAIDKFISDRGLSYDDSILYLLEALAESEHTQEVKDKPTIPKNPNQRPTKINMDRSIAEMRRRDKELINKIMRL